MSTRPDRSRRAIVRRDKLFKLNRPRDGRPRLYEDTEDNQSKEEALRPPPLLFSDGRRIDI